MIKFKIGRHWLVKALVGVALVATIGFSPHNRVLAVKGVNTPGTGNLGVVGADKGTYVDEFGNVVFETDDPTAKNSIRYRTYDMIATLGRVSKSQDLRNVSALASVNFSYESTPSSKAGYTHTKYTLANAEALAFEAFRKNPDQKYVYFHSIMIDWKNDDSTYIPAGPFYSCEQWKSGKGAGKGVPVSWGSSKRSFFSHYNIRVTLNYTKVRQKFKLEGDNDYTYTGEVYDAKNGSTIVSITKKGDKYTFEPGNEESEKDAVKFSVGLKGKFPQYLKHNGKIYKLKEIKSWEDGAATDKSTKESFSVTSGLSDITVSGTYEEVKKVKNDYKIRQKFTFNYDNGTKVYTNYKGEVYDGSTNGVLVAGKQGTEYMFRSFSTCNLAPAGEEPLYSTTAMMEALPVSSSSAGSNSDIQPGSVPDFIFVNSSKTLFWLSNVNEYLKKKGESKNELRWKDIYDSATGLEQFRTVADLGDVTIGLNYEEVTHATLKYIFHKADGTKVPVAQNGYYYEDRYGVYTSIFEKAVFAMEVGGTAELSDFPSAKGHRAAKSTLTVNSEFPTRVKVGDTIFGLGKITKREGGGTATTFWDREKDKADSFPITLGDANYAFVGHYYEENPCSVRQKFNLYGEKEEVELGVDGKTYDGETNGTVKSDLEEGEKVTFSITNSKVSSSKLEPLSFPTKITHNGTTYKLTGIKSYLNGKKPENKDFGVAGGTIKTVKGFTTLVGFYKEVKEKDKAPIEMKVKVELYDEKGTLLKTKAWWFNGTSLQDTESTIDKAVIGDSITFKKGTSLKKYNYPETLETELGEGELQKIQIVDASGTKLKEGTTSVSYKVPKSGLTGIAIYKITQPTTEGEVRMKLKVRTFDSKGNLLETEDYYYNGKTTSTTLAKLATKKIGESVTFKKGTKLKSYEFPAVFKDGEFVSITGYKNGKKDTTSDSVVTAKVPAGYYTAVAIYDKKETVPPDTSSDSSGFSKREYLDASPAAKIDADSEGAEEYNAKYFVPSSETLYTWVTSKDYLYKYTYKAVKQTKTYNSVARKKFILQWTEQVGTEKPTEPGKLGEPIYADYEDVVIKQVSVPFTFVYQYYKLESLAVYKIDKAVVKNGAFPDEQTLTPVSYIEPTCTYDVIADHVVEPSFAKEVELPSQTIGSHSVSGETSRPSAPEINKSEAVSAILAQSGNTTAKIRNSSLTINGTVCMDSKWKSGTFNSSKTEVSLACSIPKNPQSPKTTDKAVLFKSGIQIPPTKQNAIYDAEQATVYYTTVASYNNIEDSLSFECNTNQIGVLTPVICEPLIEDAKKYCQLAQIDNSRSQLVLGEKFTVHLPVVGEHLDQLGYKTRSYRKYVKTRTIKFPFDVVYEGKTIKANTTIKVANNTDVLEFIVPEWVTEGNYEVEFATIAINNPTNGTSQLKANTVRANSIATNTLKVCVSGRLYGLSLFDVSDYPLWESVFRKENSIKLTGTTYTVGTKDRNGNATTRKELYTLPMTTGKHPTTKNQGLLKTGYTMQFKLNTLGTMIGPNDSVKIIPEFYHLSADGKKLQAVDVYYSETIGKKYYPLVQVGSKTDKGNSITYRMSDSSHGINKAVAKETARLLGVSLKSIWSKAYSIGSHYQLNLPNSTRLLTGTSKYTGNADEIKKSGQTWFFEWYLPSKTHVVKKGYDVQSVLKSKGIDFKENFWLKDGTLLVRFRIQTYQNGKLHLDYYNTPSGCMNEWATERSATTCKVRKATYTLQDGDVMFFRLDRSAADDYQSGGTH